MSAGRRAIVGVLLWAAFVAVNVHGLQEASWSYALLVFAPLVIVPLLFELIMDGDEAGGTGRLADLVRQFQLPAGIILGVSCSLQPGAVAALLAFPWIVVTLIMGAIGARRAGAGGWRRPLGRLCTDVALMFTAIGGGWLFADRAGVHPLQFSPEIVALTAVHFHFAGLVLLTLTGFIVRRYSDSRFAARAAVAIVLGVPGVAVGITSSQLGWGFAIEAAAGWGLALGGIGVAILYVRIATEPFWSGVARALWAVTGVSLFFAMVLAGFYAMRGFVAPWPWLTLPWMRAAHGTLNAFGFALAGVLAWRAAGRSDAAP